jgi:Ca2+-binding EF-hand superfamily protein
MRVWGVEFTEEEITQIVKHFDTNKDGKISFEEFFYAIQA